jgi:hypothetical protein
MADQLPFGGTASLTDILTTLKDWVVAANGIVDGVQSLSPHSTSGQVIGAKLVQTGFVRLLGISVVSASTQRGLLLDAATLAAATSATMVGNVSAALGYFPVNMIFQNGLVYIPGSAQVAALFYART